MTLCRFPTLDFPVRRTRVDRAFHYTLRHNFW